MNLEEKLNEFSESLNMLSNKEYNEIEKKIELDVENSVEEEISEYKLKKKLSYDKFTQRIEKEYNKKVFNYELNCKKEIIDEEKRLKDTIRNEAIKGFYDFTKKSNYIDFLRKTVNEAISVIGDNSLCTIGITKKDLDAYEHELRLYYKINFIQIDNKYIGGCILENKEKGIYIDNTMLNIINEYFI